MKKIFLLIITFFVCVCGVRAEESYFMWHNSIDNAYTTNYDGMISSEIGKYQNDTIESLGSRKIRLNNFNAYDVMLYKDTIWELNGNNKVDFIEESDNSIITLTGSGVLRLQEIGLSMNDMLSYKTTNLEERIKTYLKGNYTLSLEDKYVVIRLNNEIPSNNSQMTNNEETPSNEKHTNEGVHNKENTKDLAFENKGFNITIKSLSKIPDGTVFIAENKLDDLKDEISEKLDNEEVKYIYDFRLQDGENSIEPSDEVEVSIKLDNGEYRVYYYNRKKELEKIDSTFGNETLIFKTNHFSEYVITSPKEIIKEDVQEEKAKKKSDNTLIICINIFIISLGILLFVIFIGKKKLK